MSMRLAGALAFSAAFTLLLIELAAGAIIEFEVLGRRGIQSPNYQWVPASEVDFWVERDPRLGVWHAPNSTFSDSRSCFHATYRSNSYGARDIERAQESEEERVLVIGDSFIEGLGVNDDLRLTTLLEAASGRPHLNFGVSGDSGSIQQALLYQHIATSFDHTDLVIAMMPFNDFRDDDFEFGRRVYPDRYRPYYAGTYPDFEVYFFLEEVSESRAFPEAGLLRLLRANLRRFSYAYNLYRYWRLLSHAQDTRSEEESSRVAYSGYYDYTVEEFQRLKYSYEQIIEAARATGREVTLITIPVLSDFARREDEGPPPLTRELGMLSSDLGVQYLDLMPLMRNLDDDPTSFYFTCDGHLSPHGNAIAAELLLGNLAIYFREGDQR